MTTGTTGWTTPEELREEKETLLEIERERRDVASGKIRKHECKLPFSYPENTDEDKFWETMGDIS